MTKDELIKKAKEEYNVSLNPKDKLADLEVKLSSLEDNADVAEKVEVVKQGSDPIASRGEHGKLVPWHPLHREESWTFVYKKSDLKKEELKKLGL